MNKRKLTSEEIEFLLDFIKPNLKIPPETAESVMMLTKKRFRKQLIDQLLYPEVIPDLKILLEKNYRESLIDPGTSVGILCAQSIGERQTQNSVSYDEDIIVKINNQVSKIKVGELIDNEIKEGIIYSDGEDSFIKKVDNIKVMTVSQDEKIEWKQVSEISKHPVNGDLIQVTTRTGRKVITTLSHSHLKKHNDSIVPILGSELKVGDRIPIIKTTPESLNNCSSVNISDYIEYDTIDDELIYLNRSNLRNTISMDGKFAWLLGAYLAEGNCTDYTVCITNINPEFEENVRLFCEFMDLSYRKTKKFGNTPTMPNTIYESISYHISSIILARFIKSLCNTGSETKKIPTFVYGASKKFIATFIKGYMDGDGNVSSGKNKEVRVHSICKELVEEFRTLCTYFGIFSTVSISKHNKNSTLYQLTIYGKEYITKFKDEIGSDLPYKKEHLNILTQKEDDCSSRVEKIPYHIGRHITKISSLLSLKGHSRTYSRYERYSDSIGRVTLGRFIQIFKEESERKQININDHLKYCLISYNSDIVWDEIVDISIIKESDYNYKYVYDFSVPGNETFALFSGIVVHNTLNTLI